MPSRPAFPRIAIIGSGFAGIGMAIQFKQAGITSFTVYEAAHEIGGTWRDNAYPGAACDVPSHLYSFSFEPNPAWSRTFGQQHEILAYLKNCVRKHQLEPFIRCHARVNAARFNDTQRTWQLEIEINSSNNTIEYLDADIVIAANGPLSRPALPCLAGLERFTGKLFHSARWDHDYSLDDKTIAVIGAGASAIQFIPQIQPHVKQLYLFQRTPPWVMPRPDHAISKRAQWLLRTFPFAQRLARYAIYWQHEVRALAFVVYPKWMKWPMKFSLKYLARRIKDPALRQKLTPNYVFGCKRVLLTSDYYPAIAQPNVEVITSPIREITAHQIITTEGASYRVDAIICATGFHLSDAGAPFTVIGAQGADLDAHWRRDGPQAYLGTSIAGFPNFFMILGPNTGLGHNSMVYMIESHIAYILDSVRTLRKRGARTMEVKPDAQRLFNARLQQALQRSVWNTGCRSWYLSASGKNVTLWPGFTFMFRWRTRRICASDYHFTP